MTVYTIDRRAHEVAERVWGRDFDGVLTCDCLLTDDPWPYRQQKCLGHLLHRCGEIKTEPRPAAALKLNPRLASLLRGAIILKRRQAQLGEARYQRACQRLEAALDRCLDQAGDPPDDALRRRVKLLRKHRSRLFTFLYVIPGQPITPPNEPSAPRSLGAKLRLAIEVPRAVALTPSSPVSGKPVSSKDEIFWP